MIISAIEHNKFLYFYVIPSVMRYIHSLNIVLAMLCYSFLTSCSGGEQKKAVNASDSSSATPNKNAWKDPRKGKIFSKVNVVQIPLTAYENRILGNVQSVTYRNYKMPGNILTDSGHNVYDKAGHLIDQNEFNADGSQKWRCVYRYDSNNKTYEWDFMFFEHKEHTKTLFKYDEKGNQVEAMTYNDQNKMTDRETITYDANGNDLVHTAYDKDGMIIRVETFTYDAKGNQVALAMKFSGKTPSRSMTVEYDDNGIEVRGTDYYSDTGKPMKWEQKNDAYGRTLERKYYKADGSIRNRSTMKYDQWNNETEMASYNTDGTLNENGSYFFEYTYDATGNVIKQATYKMKDGKREAIDRTETTYTYY
jgi:hypothetical protein